MEKFLREVALTFAHEMNQYDLGKPKKTRVELKVLLAQYWDQEFSNYIHDFIRSDSGEKVIDAVCNRYNRPYREVGVGYGTSGYHK